MKPLGHVGGKHFSRSTDETAQSVEAHRLQMLSAFALAITASSADPGYPGQPVPAVTQVRDRARAIASAIGELRQVAPEAGTYVNECDFHQENWREAFWGSNAARLEAIKRRYDDQHLFTVHHGIGSI